MKLKIRTETENVLTGLDPKFLSSPKEVQMMMGAALENFNAKIKKLPDGERKIVFQESPCGVSLGIQALPRRAYGVDDGTQGQE